MSGIGEAVKVALVGLYTVGCIWAADAQGRYDTALPVGCTIVGDVGPDERFPLAHCADGSWLYQDQDGIDGTRGTDGDGVWKDAAGYVDRGR